MLKQDADYIKLDMKKIDTLNGVMGGWLINCFGINCVYVVFYYLY